MPFLTINTNAKPSGISGRELVDDASALVAQTLGKPVSYVVATFNYNEDMAFGGSTENRGALLEMKSVGFADTQKLVEILTDFVVKTIDVERRFVNIELVDMPASTVAVGGRLLG